MPKINPRLIQPPKSPAVRPKFHAERDIITFSESDRRKARDFYENYLRSPENACITLQNMQSFWNGLHIDSLLGNGAKAMGFHAVAPEDPTQIGVCLRMVAGVSRALSVRSKAIAIVAEQVPFILRKYDIPAVKCERPCPWMSVDFSDKALKEAELAYMERNGKYRLHRTGALSKNEHQFAYCPRGTTMGYVIEALEFAGVCTMKTFMMGEMGTEHDVIAIVFNALLGLRAIYEYTDRNYVHKGSLRHSDPNLGNLLITLTPHLPIGHKSTNLCPRWTDYTEETTSQRSDFEEFLNHVIKQGSTGAYSGLCKFLQTLLDHCKTQQMDQGAAYDFVLRTLSNLFDENDTKCKPAVYGKTRSLKYSRSLGSRNRISPIGGKKR